MSTTSSAINVIEISQRSKRIRIIVRNYLQWRSSKDPTLPYLCPRGMEKAVRQVSKKILKNEEVAKAIINHPDSHQDKLDAVLRWKGGDGLEHDEVRVVFEDLAKDSHDATEALHG